MKHLCELTLKEYEEYQELIKEELTDWYSIFLLFGEDVNKMEVYELLDKQNLLADMNLNTVGVFDTYFINGNYYKLTKRMTDIKAAQFIDFQYYVSRNKLHEILSVFLIPTKLKEHKGINKYLKRNKIEFEDCEYGVGYDGVKVQQELYNHMTIGTANELAAFFLKQSTHLLDSMRIYLDKKMEKEQMKLKKSQTKTETAID